MNIHAVKHGDVWLIARDFRVAGRTSRAGKLVQSFDVWTGDRWVAKREDALTFPSADAAERYVRDNESRLVSSLPEK
jgi:hypothetical protein